MLVQICVAERARQMRLPVCHNGVHRSKKGVIVFQPALNVRYMRGSGFHVDRDESSHRFAAPCDRDCLPPIRDTSQEVGQVSFGFGYIDTGCLCRALSLVTGA